MAVCGKRTFRSLTVFLTPLVELCTLVCDVSLGYKMFVELTEHDFVVFLVVGVGKHKGVKHVVCLGAHGVDKGFDLHHTCLFIQLCGDAIPGKSAFPLRPFTWTAKVQLFRWIKLRHLHKSCVSFRSFTLTPCGSLVISSFS